jgi:ABC-2 type transport system ATP-binding protein
MTASITENKLKKSDNIASFHALAKKYKGAVIALKNASLEIKQGELLGLIGPDGAGKSTTLKLLSGVLEADSGEIRVFGRLPKDVRKQIGYVPQNGALYPDLTVDENLRYEAGLRSVPNVRFRQLRESLLQNMGLLKFSDRLAGKLSGGMKQKLALCCALISQPKLILLDEPTTGLDPLARRELWQELIMLRDQGVTTVVATPFLDEAERCDRIALMYAGSIHDVGIPADLQAALGLKRLEIIVDYNDKFADIFSEFKTEHTKNIADAYPFGDHLQLLAENAASAEIEVKDFLSRHQINCKPAHEMLPSMENVFIMRLRELGLQEVAHLPYPSKRNDTENKHGEIAISAKNLNKNFDNFQAVNQVNLDIHYGEIFGLLGANGAGKTTTIKMLCGLLKPSAGSVTLSGIKGDLRQRSVRKKIGYMSQKFTLYDNLNVQENLEFYASVYEVPLNKRKEMIAWALTSSGLQEQAKTLVGSLPLGWKQRIAFGAATMHEPEILFLDEPTAGVDPLARRQLWSQIRSLAGKGTAVLVTTHYLDEAEYCNRMAFMSSSTIVASGSPHEIKTSCEGNLYELRSNNIQDLFLHLASEIESWRLSVFGSNLHILVDDELSIDKLKAILEQKNIPVASLRSIPFSLEDAFIAVIEKTRRQG